jgi:hypothetical protein
MSIRCKVMCTALDLNEPCQVPRACRIRAWAQRSVPEESEVDRDSRQRDADVRRTCPLVANPSP